MTSRERVQKAINHIQPDKVPFDLGSTAITGISASSLTLLRKALNMYNEPVKIHEPYQVLGQVELDLIERLGIDTIGISLPNTMFGFNADNWKPWKLTDGTDVLVPCDFNTEKSPDGSLYMYPCGDRTAKPSARMPKDGHYFDTIIRQEQIDPENLKPEEWAEGMFNILTDKELDYLKTLTTNLYNNTSLSLVAAVGMGGFGDVAYVPGPCHKNPKGIRDIEEWYMAHAIYPDYIKGIYDIQLDILLKNYKLLWETVGNKIDVIVVSGTDFGTQIGPYISLNMFREFYKPYHTKANKWIHENTTWKTMYHSCGSIVELMNDLIESGVDILNPVQCSAKGMDPKNLKETYGDKIVFWGGGVDTQKTLPFGKPEDIKKEVKERMNIFGKGGGFVFNPIHNIQKGTPQKNLIALIEAVEEYRYI